MQQPFKHIKNAKYFITKMQSDLDKIKNPKAQNFQIDALNSFIMLVNSFESFLENRYKLQAVEGLICGRLFSMFFNSFVDGDSVDMQTCVRKIDEEIKFPSAKKEALVSMLFTEEVMRSVKLKNEVPNVDAKLYDGMIEKLLVEFKQQMVWS